jgi:hypothetical protein
VLSVSLQVQRHADRALQVSWPAPTLLIVPACFCVFRSEVLRPGCAGSEPARSCRQPPSASYSGQRAADSRHLPYVESERESVCRVPCRLAWTPSKTPKQPSLFVRSVSPLLAAPLHRCWVSVPVHDAWRCRSPGLMQLPAAASKENVPDFEFLCAGKAGASCGTHALSCTHALESSFAPGSSVGFTCLSAFRMLPDGNLE